MKFADKLNSDEEFEEIIMQNELANHSLQVIGSSILPVWSGQVGECLDISTQEMSRLAQQFSGVVSSLNSITSLDRCEQEKVSNDIAQAVGRILVSLQFQDRVSQILDHVRRNMMELSTQINDDSNLNIDEFIGNMVGRYTTTNERKKHRELSGNNTSDTSKEVDDGEVVFF